MTSDAFPLTPRLYLDEPETEEQCPFHLFHRLRFKSPHASPQSLLVNRTDLIEEDDGIRLQTSFGCSDEYLDRIQRFLNLRGDRGDDRDRTIVFLISAPSVGSKLTRYTSPRRGKATFRVAAMLLLPRRTTPWRASNRARSDA